MRTLLLLLLLPVTTYAQRVGLTLYGGGSLVTDQAKESFYFKRQDSRVGYYLAGEGHVKVFGWKLGAGVSAERLSLLSQRHFLTINAEDRGRIKSDIAAPALTIYGLFGKVISLPKISITPQVMAGYVTTIEANSKEMSRTYPSTNGINIGVATIASYKVGVITWSARVGLSYYALSKVDAWLLGQEVKLLTVPVALGCGIDL